MWDPSTGVSPGATIAIDWLHALSLGVFKSFATFVVHAFIDVNAWCIPGGADDRRAGSTASIRAELFAWYASENKAGRFPNRVQDLTKGMLGESSDAVLGLHGAETNSFIHFLMAVVVPAHKHKLGPLKGDLVSRAVFCSLVVLMNLIKEHGWSVMPPPKIQEFCDAACEHIACVGALGLQMKPKHHMLLELGARLLWHGGPSMYGCWQDESINGLVASIAVHAHRLVWAKRLLIEWRKAYGLERRRSRVNA